MRARIGALAALAALALAPAAAAKPLKVALDDGVTAVLGDDHEIRLEASPRRGEGLLAFTRRLCGDPARAPLVAKANRGREKLEVGTRYRIPFELLAPDVQLRTARRLFARDAPEADGWRHTVRGVGPLERESLWHLARWFTGNGENFRAIREYNELDDEDLPGGASLVIPAELLLPAFRGALPVSDGHRLQFGKDAAGEYAVYRLRPGEALYSGVVVRFTGRVFGADVNALAAELAARNGIRDVTDIPVGFRVKIPVDRLLPEFLPEGHPRRREYEQELAASARFSNQVRAKGLAGITVILDAGHGGRDSGTTMAGVWESTYVYDIVLRVKRLLEAHTAAQVAVTTRDGESFQIHDADVLPFSRRHAVLTTPPYPIEDATVGVNLRWYLANSVYRRALAGDAGPEKVVFLSIHADSLHPSLRGVMAYIPAAGMRQERYGKSSSVYTARREVQESPSVTFPWEERVKSEGLSRELAQRVVDAFAAGGLAVHPFKPVRDKIIRENGQWVPAVLRYNSVPAKALLEVCNLANDEDRRLLQTRAYRQRVAESIVAGLLAYYGERVELPPAQVASTAKARAGAN
ncbi:MAG TPA: N-acetylmuramoyl-L-alanine amidase [Thermoanaerobaculia bacterium]|nr:N-acetylmuramoyl-L-alanine amidase [Thermoanaerobaculia bacterium]